MAMPMNVLYVTNMSNDDFSPGTLTVIMIIFVNYRGHLLASQKIFKHYIFEKN